MKTIRFLLAFIASMTLSLSAAAQGMCHFTEEPRIIYDDAFEPGWSTFFWGTISAIPSTIAGKSGSTALQVVTSTANAGIQIQATGAGPFNTNGHKALTFMLRRETSVPVYVSIVKMIDSTTSVVGQSVIAGSQYSLPQTNMSSNEYGMWQIITIPLSALQATNVSFGGVVFTAGAPTTFYLDKIELTNGFLSFPLDCSNASCSGGAVDYRVAGAYTASSVTSVHDHSMKKNATGWYPYATQTTDLDGKVYSWTGEKAKSTTGFPTAVQGCYPRETGTGTGPFSVYGTYGGGGGCPVDYLNYDDHPGYDYKAVYDTPVYAAAGGTVVSIDNDRCYRNNFTSCSAMGAIGIDHGNGYITQYLHLKPSSIISLNSGDIVSSRQQIGLSSDTGVPGNPHLHFEVLKRVPGLTSGTYAYKMVDPYGWYADGMDDPLMQIGAPSFLLWK